ncbi:MAG: ABC transporter permease [Phycisphaerales bacterium]|nr:ABC transporter permease [Phycisphaerales bacterium]
MSVTPHKPGVDARWGVRAWLTMVPRSLRQHAVSTSITVLAVALACGLVMSVFTIQRQAHDAFIGGPVGFDAVLGARGSKLQLVLNSVFHLETSPGNIPWTLYEEIRKTPGVKAAIPMAVGDNYRGFRIVGVTPQMFDIELAQGVKLKPETGRLFDPTLREAVVGSFAAQRTGLRVGAFFNPSHGVSEGGETHEEQYKVVGILAPTNTPNDRAIWIPIEGVYRMAGHELRGSGERYVARPGQAIPDEDKEVSAVLLKLAAPQFGAGLDQMVNKQGNRATLAWPIATVIADLFSKMGWVTRILELVAYLVVLVSAAAIMAGIYNTINERRREFAILRALGARRSIVFGAIVLESGAIAAIGALLGFAVYFAIVASAAVVIRDQTGVVLDIWQWHNALALTPVGMTLAGAIVGIVPAVKAYSTDVAGNLAPQT